MADDKQKIKDAIVKIKKIRNSLTEKIEKQNYEDNKIFNNKKSNLEESCKNIKNLKNRNRESRNELINLIILGLMLLGGLASLITFFVFRIWMLALISFTMWSSAIILSNVYDKIDLGDIKNLFKNIKKRKQIKNELKELKYEKSVELVKLEEKRDCLDKHLKTLEEKLNQIENVEETSVNSLSVNTKELDKNQATQKLINSKDQMIEKKSVLENNEVSKDFKI